MAEAVEGEVEEGFEDAGGGIVAERAAEGCGGRGVQAVGKATAHAHVVPTRDIFFKAFCPRRLAIEGLEAAAHLVGLFGRTRVAETAVVEGC